MLSRSLAVYIIMLVIFGAGLWMIIGFGSVLLAAPEDLAGDWELFTPGQTDAIVRKLRIDQSGQFLQISIANGPKLQMKMTSTTAGGEAKSPDAITIALEGEQSKATFSGRTGGDVWKLEMSGALAGSFQARIVNRTYPKPATASQIQKLATELKPH